jgi:chemotaxis-related protein WspD
MAGRKVIPKRRNYSVTVRRGGEVTGDTHLWEQNPQAECWKSMGTFGDRTCPRLSEEIHCRNCEVYRAGGRNLLDRPQPDAYREELTRQLAEPEELAEEKPLELVLFRIGGAWLALPSRCFARTLPILPVVPMPGRSNAVFLGMVNAHGDIRLCASLVPLIGTETDRPVIDVSARVFPRMLEISLNGNLWVFVSDEVVGSIECEQKNLEALPANLAIASDGLVTGLFEWFGLRVALLAHERLFALLEEALA